MTDEELLRAVVEAQRDADCADSPGHVAAEVIRLVAAEMRVRAIAAIEDEEQRLHDAGECPHVGERPACWRGASIIRGLPLPGAGRP